MVEKLMLILGLAAPDYSSAVAAQASYTLHTNAPLAVTECCGQCKGGKIVHGDGHVTECPCPTDCKCKGRKETICTTGTCAPPK